MTTEIKPYFTTSDLNQLARDVGFVQRKSKLDGALFLSLLVLYKEDLEMQSLNRICFSAEHDYNLQITKQSLHERFNSSAVLFLKTVLEKIIQKNLLDQGLLGKISEFSRFRIKDSTSFQVDENVKSDYPGSGGSGSGAAVRIQFEFDLMTGSIIDLSLHAYNDQDAKDAITTISTIKENELIVRDLGYMYTAALRKINEQKAYFLCRLHPSTKAYAMNKSGILVELDFKAELRRMQKMKISSQEKEVYLDKGNPLKVRLLLQLLPQDAINIRMAKIKNLQMKKKRNEPTEDFKARNHLNLFITNASKEQISSDVIWTVYRFRWIVELIFKVWKSVYKIHKTKKVSIHRLECYIYTKLIIAMSNWNLTWKLMIATKRISNEIVSFDKCSKYLNLVSTELKGLYLKGFKQNVLNVIDTMCNRINDLLIERHGEKPTLLELYVNLKADLA